MLDASNGDLWKLTFIWLLLWIADLDSPAENCKSPLSVSDWKRGVDVEDENKGILSHHQTGEGRVPQASAPRGES